jgi:hypothetical protein
MIMCWSLAMGSSLMRLLLIALDWILDDGTFQDAASGVGTVFAGESCNLRPLPKRRWSMSF